ncbi:MAG TPA: ankyrin repeat domain-containing protein [Leptospiraceae bacterium]|nr:ankyrin repeat domain-containing protein [Leptospiraceae bacterium]HMW06270.1 ankyrin repeat domain-containing protein [Leptospiraceae bacterium]HMX33169.1 ankyrin repeat domain-containing protein [Leptospiraceae bacterium]HMY31732.1 ankyrin repeat domain-containing protein [Leptospiraceae bacterium]HMZ64525.1 ankyrin repeat domain-containing protein [Leptospiraceae bacterium]
MKFLKNLFLPKIQKAILENDFNKIENSEINEYFSNGSFPLEFAIEQDKWESAKYLLDNKADPDKRIHIDEQTLVMSIIQNNYNLKYLNLLIEYEANLNLKDKNGYSAVIHCILTGHLEALKILLENQADPNLQDKDGATALNHAKSTGGLSELIDLLLEYGADPNIKDRHGKTYNM